MKSILILALIHCSLRAIDLAEEGKKLVDKFSFDTFKNKISKGNKDKWFFMANTSTSKLYKELKDTFNKLAYSERGGNTRFGEIDCNEHSKLCKLLRIRNYPTFFMIDKDKIYNYIGLHDENSISRFFKDGWNKVKSVKISQDLPTLWEDIYSSVFDIYNRIIDVYKTKNILMKSFVTIFIIILSSILGAVFYFLYQAFNFAKQHKDVNKYKGKAKAKEE